MTIIIIMLLPGAAISRCKLRPLPECT